MEKRSRSGSKHSLRAKSKAKNKGKGKKASGSKNMKRVNLDVPKRTSLLDVLHNQDDCNCEVVAKAVTSNVHKNFALSEIKNHSRDLDMKEIEKN